MVMLFGIDIQALVAQNLGQQLYDATLARKSYGSYDSNDPSAGRPITTTTYTCKGVPTKLDTAINPNQVTIAITGEVMVLLGTLPAGICPQPEDTITLVDPRTLQNLVGVITKVSGDPAGAQVTCKVLG